ncbi:MAG: MFS transporter [Caulobacteraceae bacterium]|nr:MFS transporter [Caulobacteraceae bacterium]
MSREIEAVALQDEPVVNAAAPRKRANTGGGFLAGAGRNQVSVALACLLGNIVSPTPIVHGPFGLFLIPISHEFGWPRERVSGVLSLLALITAIAYPIIGRLADRLGPRRLILFGNLAFGACVIALGFSRPSVLVFYGLFALIGVFGSMPSTMMYNRVISGWFDKARGSMLGLTSGLGNGTGATIMPFIALALMTAFGWRGAFFGLGGLVIAVGFPTLFFLLKEPPVHARGDQAQRIALEGMSLSEAARTSTFWMTLISIGLGAGCLTAVLAHVVPILTDRHFPVKEATLVVSVFAMVTAGFQIVVGWLLDKTGSPKMIAPLYLIAVAGMLTLEHGSSLPVLVLGGALMGVGMGAEFGCLPYFISRYFGLRRFGMIAGVMYSAVIIAQGATPYLMDVDFDHHRSYLLALHVIEFVLVGGAAVIAFLPRYSATMSRWKSAPAAA